MEDIEYLEEYKDLVLPTISTNAKTASQKSNDAKARDRRRKVEELMSSDGDDSSSSAIDMDIFEKLFHGNDNSDNDDVARTQNQQKKKLTKLGVRKPNVRAGPESFSSSDYDSDASVYRRLLGGRGATRVGSQKSLDSIDALVRDLGDYIDKPDSRTVGKTKDIKSTKTNNSATYTPKAMKNIKSHPSTCNKMKSKQKIKESCAGKTSLHMSTSTTTQEKLNNTHVKTEKRSTEKPSTIKTLQKSTKTKPTKNVPQTSTNKASLVKRTILTAKDLGIKKEPEPSVDPLDFDDDSDLISVTKDDVSLTTSEDDNDESICYASSDDFSDDSDAEDLTVIDISTDSNLSKANSDPSRRRLGASHPEITKILESSLTNVVTPKHVTRAQCAELSTKKPRGRGIRQWDLLMKDLNNMSDIGKRQNLSTSSRSPTVLQKRIIIDDLPDAKRWTKKVHTINQSSETDSIKQNESIAYKKKVDKVPETVTKESTKPTTSITATTKTPPPDEKTPNTSVQAEKTTENVSSNTKDVSKALAQREKLTTPADNAKQQPVAEVIKETVEDTAKPTAGMTVEAKIVQHQKTIAKTKAVESKIDATAASPVPIVTTKKLETAKLTRNPTTTTTTPVKVDVTKVEETVATAKLATHENTQTRSASKTVSDEGSKTNQTVPVAIIAVATTNQISAADFGKTAQTPIAAGIQTKERNKNATATTQSEMPATSEPAQSRASSRERTGRGFSNATPTPVATRKSTRAHVTPAKYDPDMPQKSTIHTTEIKPKPTAAAVSLHKTVSSAVTASSCNETPVPVKLSTTLELIHATRGVKRRAAPLLSAPTMEDSIKRTRTATPMPAFVSTIRPVPVNMLQQQQQTPTDAPLATTASKEEYLHRKWQPRVRINRKTFYNFCRTLTKVSEPTTLIPTNTTTKTTKITTMTRSLSPISIPSTDELLSDNNNRNTPVATNKSSNGASNAQLTINEMPRLAINETSRLADLTQVLPTIFTPIIPKVENVDEPTTNETLVTETETNASAYSMAAATRNVTATISFSDDMRVANSEQNNANAAIQHSTDGSAASVGTMQTPVSVPAANDDNIIGRTRMYTYLSPIKYNRSYEKVQLDYCCPSLNGPMIAIDPTRLYQDIQMPVRELPASIVMTTKVVKSSEYQKNRELLPEPVRLKIERRNGGLSVASFLAAGGGVLNKHNDQTASKAQAEAVSQQQSQAERHMPATMQLLKKCLPPSSTVLKTGYVLPTAKEATTTAMPVPVPAPEQIGNAVAQVTPPSCLERLHHAQIFDDLLQQIARRVLTFSPHGRQRIISAIATNSNLEATDFQIGIKLLSKYKNWIDRVAMLRAQPAAAASNSMAATLSTTAAIMSTAAVMPAASTIPTTAVMPTTVKSTSTQQANMQTPPNSRPIYDDHKNVIGYQRLSLNRTTPMLQAKNVAITTATTTAATSTTRPTNMPITTAVLPHIAQQPKQKILPSNLYATAHTPSTAATIRVANNQLRQSRANITPSSPLSSPSIAANDITTTTSSCSSILMSYITRPTTSLTVRQRVNNEQSQLMNITIAADNFNTDVIMRDLNSGISSSGSNGAEECILPDAVMITKEIKREKSDDEVC